MRTGWLAGLGIAVVVGCSAPQPPSTPSPTPSPAATPFACTEPIDSQLPEWARTGFSPPDQLVAHFMGEEGNIVAVPFGWPLREKQPEGRANKVLWIARVSAGGPMTIEARREGSPTVEHREVAGGPGPSIIDLPAQGCWRFDLAWPGGSDRVYLRYLGAA